VNTWLPGAAKEKVWLALLELPQLSEAVAVKEGAALQAVGLSVIVASAGQTELGLGAVGSTTTLKVHVAAGLQESSALQVTVVTPIGNAEPEGWSQTTAGLAAQLSVAVTLKVTVAS
jgi:hypothetical protein